MHLECSDCIATDFCNKYKGNVNSGGGRCNSKFRLYSALKLSNIPKAYYKANIANYVIDEDNKSVYQNIKPRIDNIVQEVNEGLNVLFHGKGSGSGKTYNAMCFLNQYIYKTCSTPVFDFEHPLAMYVDYTDLIHKLRYKKDHPEVVDLFNTILDVPLLLLDDVCAGTMSEFAVEQTFLLINHRFNESKSTILTSNYNREELSRDSLLGYRIVSRISKNILDVRVTGKDRRRAG